MNHLVLLTILAILANIQPLTGSQKNLIKLAKIECEEESEVDAAIMKKLRQEGHVTNDKKLIEYFCCFLNRADAIDQDGNLQKNVLKMGLDDAEGKEIAHKILDECLLKFSTMEETVFEYFKCSMKYRKNWSNL